MFPPFSRTHTKKNFSAQGYDGLIFLISVMGSFFLNGSSPLFYELVVELTYPVPESISASGLTIMNNIGCLILQVSRSSSFSLSLSARAHETTF